MSVSYIAKAESCFVAGVNGTRDARLNVGSKVLKSIGDNGQERFFVGHILRVIASLRQVGRKKDVVDSILELAGRQPLMGRMVHQDDQTCS